VKHLSRNDQDGMTKFSTWGEKPQSDWKPQVSFNTAKNTQRVPFVIKDVVLPQASARHGLTMIRTGDGV